MATKPKAKKAREYFVMPTPQKIKERTMKEANAENSSQKESNDYSKIMGQNWMRAQTYR